MELVEPIYIEVKKVGGSERRIIQQSSERNRNRGQTRRSERWNRSRRRSCDLHDDPRRAIKIQEHREKETNSRI